MIRNIVMGFLSICGVILWCILVLAVLTVNVTLILWMVYIGVICGFVGYIIVTVMEKTGKFD
jgi:general stress protein CsbA